MIDTLRRLLARRKLRHAGAVDPRLERYMHLPFGRWRKVPIQRARYVVFDTETTGLDIASSAPLSLAAVVVDHGRVHVDSRLELVFHHDHVGGKQAAPIHGLLRADVESAPPAEKAVLQFLDFAGDSVLVGHHVGFDVAILDKVLARSGPGRILNDIADTEHVARRLETAVLPRDGDVLEPQSLDTLCERYGIPLDMRHTAAGDALATAMLWLVLLGRAHRRGITTVGRLLSR
jgi:DNA polymerase-3 subunit epsilon